jgi:ABC-type Fe3+-siderophore transport system permease subunit
MTNRIGFTARIASFFTWLFHQGPVAFIVGYALITGTGGLLFVAILTSFARLVGHTWREEGFSLQNIAASYICTLILSGLEWRKLRKRQLDPFTDHL